MTKILPPESLVRPVAGEPDAFSFRFDFELEGKAVEDGTAPVVTETDEGDLIIEGYAAVFEGLDREGENFIPGAFQRGIKSFLNSQAALCFHHKHDQVIGKVLDLREEEGKGLWMKARVDHQQETSPLRHIYDGVKKGSMSGLSVGGFFKRVMDKGRRMIGDMDFTEISITGVPVHAGTNFSVVAGKALTSDIEIPDTPDVEGEIREEDLRTVNYLIEELGMVFDRITQSVNQRKTSAA